MRIEFENLANQFRQVAAQDDVRGPGLAADADVKAARAVKEAIDGRLLRLPVYRQEILSGPNDEPSQLVETEFQWPELDGSLPPWKARDLANSKWQMCWNSIVSVICAQHPAEFSFDPHALHLVEVRDCVQFLVSDPSDWQRRARHSATVCEWLATATAAEPAYHIGDMKYQVGDDIPILLEESEDHVLRSLIDLGGTASKSQLERQAGKTDGPRILKAIREKHPALAPHITLPGGRGKGGYRTTIRRAN